MTCWSAAGNTVKLQLMASSTNTENLIIVAVSKESFALVESIHLRDTTFHFVVDLVLALFLIRLCFAHSAKEPDTYTQNVAFYIRQKVKCIIRKNIIKIAEERWLHWLSNVCRYMNIILYSRTLSAKIIFIFHLYKKNWLKLKKCVLLGYTHNGYKLLNLFSNRVITVRDVILDENNAFLCL